MEAVWASISHLTGTGPVGQDKERRQLRGATPFAREEHAYAVHASQGGAGGHFASQGGQDRRFTANCRLARLATPTRPSLRCIKRHSDYSQLPDRARASSIRRMVQGVPEATEGVPGEGRLDGSLGIPILRRQGAERGLDAAPANAASLSSAAAGPRDRGAGQGRHSSRGLGTPSPRGGVAATEGWGG